LKWLFNLYFNPCTHKEKFWLNNNFYLSTIFYCLFKSILIVFLVSQSTVFENWLFSTALCRHKLSGPTYICNIWWVRLSIYWKPWWQAKTMGASWGCGNMLCYLWISRGLGNPFISSLFLPFHLFGEFHFSNAAMFLYYNYSKLHLHLQWPPSPHLQFLAFSYSGYFGDHWLRLLILHFLNISNFLNWLSFWPF